MFYIAGAIFLAFIMAYLIISSAVVYHLNAFTLPEWRGRKISIVIFTILSIFFIGLAVWFFFQVPWSSYVVTS